MPLSATASVALADTAPLSEKTTPDAGQMPLAARADHQHARPTWTADGATGADGKTTLTFGRTFDVNPTVLCMALENNTSAPPAFKAMSFTTNASGKVTGCTVFASRPLIAGLLPAPVAIAFNYTAIKQSTDQS